MFQIGQTKQFSGVSVKQIRYYESIGLLSKTRRRENGYRVYEERHVHELRFIKRARELGFPLKEIHELLALWRNRRRSNAQVRKLAERHRNAIRERVKAHRKIVQSLDRLIASCKSNARPDCPILDELAH